MMQISGRAARNLCGKVILFADRMTNSIKAARAEMKRRRKFQMEYNKANGINPKTIKSRELKLSELYAKSKEESFDLRLSS